MKVKAAGLLLTLALCFAALPVSTLAVDKADATDATPKQSIPFTDVAEETAYADAVRWAVENGVAIGMNDGTFAPDAVCTRAQMITFLWRAAGSPAVNYYMPYSPFEDVPTDAWYTNAVLWAASEGIISGDGNGLFEPNAGCTKAQTITLLWRAAGSPAVNYLLPYHPFTDVPAGAWFENAVIWAATVGVVKGDGTTAFEPDTVCDRAQIITFLFNAQQTSVG